MLPMILSSLMIMASVASASNPLPSWYSVSPPGASVVVKSSTTIAERIYLVGEQPQQQSATSNCWVSMLDSIDDDLEYLGADSFRSPVASTMGVNSKASPSLQQQQSFQSENTRCSLVAAGELHGELVLLGVEDNLELGSAFSQVFVKVGMSTDNILLVPSPGVPVGLLTDSRSNMIVVASVAMNGPRNIQDLYLHAYRMVGDRSAELLLVWEQFLDDLVSPEESFTFAGMAMSSGVLTVAGSTGGTPNLSSSSSSSSSSTPMDKSMFSWYAKFADAFVVQMEASTGLLNNVEDPLTRLHRPNDLNEHAYGMCQDPNDENIAYIVGQVVSENDSRQGDLGYPTGVPQVTKIELNPFQVVWSSSLEDLQSTSSSTMVEPFPSYLALQHCVVSSETGDLFVAGTSSPDLPSRFSSLPIITDPDEPEPSTRPLFPEDGLDSPIDLNDAANPIACSGGKIYNEFFGECACPEGEEEEFFTGVCFPELSPCLHHPCGPDKICVHIPAPAGDPFPGEDASYTCTGSSSSSSNNNNNPAIPTNSISTSCSGGKVYDSFIEECICPGDMDEESFTGRCYPMDSPCLDQPCGEFQVCEHVDPEDEFGVAEYWCRDAPSRTRRTRQLADTLDFASKGSLLVPTEIVVAKISPSTAEILWSETLDSDLSYEQLTGLQIDHFSQHPLVIGNTFNINEDGTSEAFIMTLHSDNGSVIQQQEGEGEGSPFVPPSVEPFGDDCTGGKIFDEFFEECACPEGEEEEFFTGVCFPEASPCLDQPCGPDEICVHVPAEFGDATFSCQEGGLNSNNDAPDLADPIWMHQDTQEEFGSPPTTTSSTLAKQNQDMEEEDSSNISSSTKQILTIVFGVIGGILVCCFLSVTCIKANKRRRTENNQKRVMNIFSYLHPFDVDDIDIRKSPAGGFLGTYKNDLAHGENGAGAGAADSSISSSDGDQQKLV